ncbi:hypothetical protein PHMEG_00011304 [Phytophthora megakarya]|uniref:Uncharacterized protein n=1 Tax=Phytophthora megakarya TaxID=4795 RepID=A0A225WBL3_9STRA|nr:hypothetical protein PHMEG_00011304 [Phytophthora megakarya]
MVHIINGEIVADDDPRVRARQQPQQTQPHRRFGSVHDGVSNTGAAPTGPPPAPASPFQGLARQVGLEGTVTIPAVLGLPARPVQKVHLAVAALLTAFFGWRALVFLAFAYFLSTQQPPAPRQT